MHRKARASAAVLSTIVVALSALACTGMTLGENRPGRDTYLSAGAIAVDHRSETAFVVQFTQPADSATPADASAMDGGPAPTIQTLFAVRPDTGPATRVADLTGMEDLRMLFPLDSILLMAEHDGHDQLRRLDRNTFAETARVESSVRYNGTRMSPSGRYLAVADNTSSLAPIHVIDTATLVPHVIPHGGSWLEAMWLNNSDRLFAIVFYDGGVASSHARILSWTMSRVAADGFPMAGDVWAAPELDITVPGVDMDFAFSFTWIGVSPNDRSVVFPVRYFANPADRENFVYRLLVLDTATSTLRNVDNARGPVGFSPDGATIVSYRYVTRAGGTDAGRADAGRPDANTADAGAADALSSVADSADTRTDDALGNDASTEDALGGDATLSDASGIDVRATDADGVDASAADASRGDAAVAADAESVPERDAGFVTVPQLLLIDTMTLAVRDMDLPLSGGPQFFVTREGHHVAIVSNWQDEDLIVYDIDTQRMTQLRHAAVALNEFVSRIGHHELWMISGGLSRLDFMSPRFERIPLDWTPGHVNILPMRDRLVMDDIAGSRLVFWSPVSRTVVRSVPLPMPMM